MIPLIGKSGAFIFPLFSIRRRFSELLPIICHLVPQPEMESAKIATAKPGNRSTSQFRYLCRGPRPSRPLINCAEICFHCSKRKQRRRKQSIMEPRTKKERKKSLFALHSLHPSQAVMFVQLTFMAFNDALFQFSGSKVAKQLFLFSQKNLKIRKSCVEPVVIWQIII